MKKISVKMLVFFLPAIVASLVILTYIGIRSSRNIIDEQIGLWMNSELNGQMNSISGEIGQIRQLSTTLSDVVVSVYQMEDLPMLETLLEKMASQNDRILGCGIWFEPGVYKAGEKYVGPYVYRNGSKFEVTYEYSNAEYDYFNQEYYKNVANGEKAPVMTDPYYDETSGVIMSSCAMPMYQGDKFIGCVTVDMELTAIQNLVNQIRVGDSGNAIMLAKDGTYISVQEQEKASKGVKIQEEENASLAEAGARILASKNGKDTYILNGENRNLYYGTLPKLGWKLILQIPQSELDAPVEHLRTQQLFVCVVVVLVMMTMVLLAVMVVTRELKKVQIFAGWLAEGDFSVEPLNIRTKDELGLTGNALNKMFSSNKAVIRELTDRAKSIQASSDGLNGAVTQLAEEFSQINSYMTQVTEAMLTSGAATQEVTASVEDVTNDTSKLSEETVQSLKLANEIRERAQSIKETSEQAYDNAAKLAGEYTRNLEESIDNAKVVESIRALANVISNIAEQINLLSLNASIEAARAGAQGRGFAVVANEIGKLAGETTQAVGEIQSTVHEVQGTFDQLVGDSRRILDFLQNTVTPDYENFVQVSKQYGEDAESIDRFSHQIADMSDNIAQIMEEVNSTAEEIANSTQQTAENSSSTLTAVQQLSETVSDLAKISEQEKVIADGLIGVAEQFKLE